MIPRQQIKRWCEAVAREFKPQKVILFGSYGYGKPTEDSDVDILVVMSLTSGRRDVQQAAAIRDKVRASFPMDVIVRTPEQIHKRLARGDQFISEILRRGQVVYESGNP